MLEIGKNPVEIRIFIRLILNECGYKVKRLCCCKCLYEAIKIDTRNEARQAKNWLDGREPHFLLLVKVPTM